jgi:thiol-disulfide isomerase/thioredoxin
MTRGATIKTQTMLLVLSALLFGLSHSLEFFEGVDNIVVVNNKKDLSSKVLESQSLTLLGAFSEDPEECPGCDKIAKEFTKAAKNLAGYGVSVVAVDCTGAIPACHGMTKDLMLTNIPFVRSYVSPPAKNPYTKKWGRDGVTFDGNADARSLQKHVLNKIPSMLLEKQTSETFPPTNDGKSLVLLFTERESPSVLIKALAYYFQDRLLFAEVSENEESLMETFAVSKTPTLLVTFADKLKEDSQMGVVYKGDPKSFDDMVDFLEPFAILKESSSNSEENSTKKNKKNEKDETSNTISPHAIFFNDENEFNNQVHEGSEAWAVLYYPGGNKMITKDNKYDNWIKDSEKYTNPGPLMKVGEVNCSHTPTICQSSSLPNIKKPQIIVYDYIREKGLKRNEIDTSTDIYPLSECSDALESVSQSIPDFTYKMNSANLDQIAGEALQQEKIMLILASNKDEPPLMLKQLAIDLKPIAIVAFLQSPDATMMQQFQLERVPSFVSMYPQSQPDTPQGIQFAIARFDPRRFGKSTFETVFSFTLQVAMSVNPQSVDKLAKEREQKQAPSTVSTTMGPVNEVTSASWTKLCDPKSAKLCAIAFLSGSEESASFNHEMEVAQSAFKAHAADPYSFMWVNGFCQSEFSESFDVQPNQHPTVVVYSPKKNRFASFIGTYSTESIRDLLSGVLSGRVKTREVFQLTSPQDRDCSQLSLNTNNENDGESGLEEMEDDEDMSDMMAEILAEEAKKKAELAAELKAEAAEKKRLKAEEEEALKEAEKKKAAKKKKKKKTKKKGNEL